jgi:hypothetical protein
LSVSVDHDISGALWSCTPADQVISDSKAIYYAAKFLKLIA